ncbi:MAG TPA: YeeE/YedE family protein [Kofleriaceae bacterium]|nr:YeeE/YedE family protein [Kofleriaceae bacterium]
MHDFTPVRALFGGVLIAASLALMLIGTGRIAGLSGIFAGILRGKAGDTAWRVWFVAGMLAIGLVFRIASPRAFDHEARVPLWAIALSGVLVGIGTRASNGCTSGHGLCGMSRPSKRSIVATIVFFGVGVATATLVGQLVRSA